MKKKVMCSLIIKKCSIRMVYVLEVLRSTNFWIQTKFIHNCREHLPTTDTKERIEEWQSTSFIRRNHGFECVFHVRIFERET